MPPGDLRSRILESTTKLLREEGLAAATSRRIARGADCSEGSIYVHFGDKGSLLAAVLSSGLPEAAALWETADRGASVDLREGLAAVLEAVRAYYAASYRLVGIVLVDRELFAQYSRSHREGGTGPQQVWRAVHRFLDAHRGGLPGDLDLEVEAVKLAGACQNSVWVEMVSGPGELPRGDPRLLIDDLVGSLTR
ncbi:TetR/AcrR family transcriptional regulator [Pseudonocardia endophytica]|uniref:TetR family transcriptional regulator n=1 Tax=Pseudonocardia endophytica TaxID=401976 RepID=A0A4R1HPS3_PSEEN|nr:TetR/AcrR family transcriptional regulator [Pseudonocardia endophytica]TCK24567.1 TetR family transcriptional regulator [Pseudonocardia endophytica]